MELITCPECGNAAEIVWRDVVESTDGPIEHAKIMCVARHWFLMPVALLESPRLPERTRPSGDDRLPRRDRSRPGAPRE